MERTTKHTQGEREEVKRKLWREVLVALGLRRGRAVVCDVSLSGVCISLVGV